MNEAAAADDAPRWALPLWAVFFIGLPLLVASLSNPGAVLRHSAPHGAAERTERPPTPPPAVEPAEILKITPQEARAINAAVPFSTDPNPAARPFHFAGSPEAEARAVDCLAAAQYYEAGDDGPGQKAVAQVVLNRLRHPAFPKSVCGVVFQGEERVTGCQFTFTCDGALARSPSAAAWERAQKLARLMLAGTVDKRVGHATHYHTDWVVPYWSSSLDKITSVDTHLFFRWKGWWGTPPAFRGAQMVDEPVIARIAFLSPAYNGAAAAGATGPIDPLHPDFSDLATQSLTIGRDRIGDRFGPARLAALNSTGDAFIMLLDKGTTPAAFEQLARQMCGGRTKCRLLAWTRMVDMPNGFPIDMDTLATMSASYMRVADAGLERVLYNCSEFKDMAEAKCMKARLPAPPPLPPVRTGSETIRLTPQ